MDEPEAFQAALERLGFERLLIAAADQAISGVRAEDPLSFELASLRVVLIRLLMTEGDSGKLSTGAARTCSAIVQAEKARRQLADEMAEEDEFVYEIG